MSDDLDKELEQVSEGSPENPPEGSPEKEEKPKGYMDYDEWVAAGKDPDQWRDLETWKQKGEDFLPFVQKERDELRKQVKNLQNDVSKVIDQQEKLTEKQTRDAYEKAKADYDAKLEQVQDAKAKALDDMDGESFKKAEKMEKELQTQVPEPPQNSSTSPSSGGPDPAADPDFQAWHKENTWYKPESTDPDDRAMAVYASDMSVQLQKQNPNLQGKALYDKVTETVKNKFPQSFDNPKRAEAASVEEGAPSKSKGQKGYKDLPSEAKQAIKRVVDRNPNVNKERLIKGYVNEYFPES